MPLVHKKIEMTLELSPKEALWLKLNMQNPVGPEGSEDYNMRKSFFDSLPDIHELYSLQE